MCRMPELMQLLMGMSTSRYFPAIGTAGLARSFVNGNSRLPSPPPMITPNTLSGVTAFIPEVAMRETLSRKRRLRQLTKIKTWVTLVAIGGTNTNASKSTPL